MLHNIYEIFSSCLLLRLRLTLRLTSNVCIVCSFTVGTYEDTGQDVCVPGQQIRLSISI